jgi:hypothetical protein
VKVNGDLTVRTGRSGRLVLVVGAVEVELYPGDEDVLRDLLNERTPPRGF